jgi:hypothetical protein
MGWWSSMEQSVVVLNQEECFVQEVKRKLGFQAVVGVKNTPRGPRTILGWEEEEEEEEI